MKKRADKCIARLAHQSIGRVPATRVHGGGRVRCHPSLDPDILAGLREWREECAGRRPLAEGTNLSLSPAANDHAICVAAEVDDDGHNKGP